MLLLFDKEYLKGAEKDPLEAINRFLAKKQKRKKNVTFSNDQK